MTNRSVVKYITMSPRTKSQLDNLKAEKREVIISAAMGLFSEKGYQSTSISMIAAGAGISKGLVYTYFKSKEELLKSLVIDTIKEMFGIALQCFSENNGDEGFVKMIDTYINWVKDNYKFLRIYFGIVLQPNILTMFEKDFMELAEPVFACIANYFSAKGSANPMLETRYLTSILDGVYLNYIVDPITFPIDEVKGKIIDQFIK